MARTGRFRHHLSYAGLTRVPIHLQRVVAKRMDCRVKPGNDILTTTIRPSAPETSLPMSNAPRYEIDVPAFWADPYPDLARMRKETPIAFVPQLNSTVFTRRADIYTQEKRIELFSSHQPGGLMNVLMGHNMMRKDGEAHMAERAQMFPAVSPRTVKATWLAQFQAH